MESARQGRWFARSRLSRVAWFPVPKCVQIFIQKQCPRAACSSMSAGLCLPGTALQCLAPAGRPMWLSAGTTCHTSHHCRRNVQWYGISHDQEGQERFDDGLQQFGKLRLQRVTLSTSMLLALWQICLIDRMPGLRKIHRFSC